jgi:hypothetical protein
LLQYVICFRCRSRLPLQRVQPRKRFQVEGDNGRYGEAADATRGQQELHKNEEEMGDGWVVVTGHVTSTMCVPSMPEAPVTKTFKPALPPADRDKDARVVIS